MEQLDGIVITGTSPEAWNAEAVALLVRWQPGMGVEPDAAEIDWALWLRGADERVIARACEDVARRKLDTVDALRRLSYSRADVRQELANAATALYWIGGPGRLDNIGYWANMQHRLPDDAFLTRRDDYQRAVVAGDVAYRAAELTYGQTVD